MLHLAANVNSRLEVCQKCEDTLSPRRGECDGVRGSLVIMMLAMLVRGQGSTPCWGTDVLAHCYNMMNMGNIEYAAKMITSLDQVWIYQVI